MKLKYLPNVVTLQYDESKCTGCQRCTEVCPRGVFAMNGTKARIVDRNSCIECGACSNNCQFGAISVDSGVGCAAALITAMVTGSEVACGCGGGDEDQGSTSGCC